VSGEEVNNMPRKTGTPKLTKQNKAEIVAAKKLRLSTVKNIAAAHGVEPNTVYSVVRKADSEVSALAATIEEQIKSKAKNNVIAGLDSMAVKISDPNQTLRDVAGATKINYDILRVQSGLPTVITEREQSPDEKAVARFKSAIENEPFMARMMASVKKIDLVFSYILDAALRHEAGANVEAVTIEAQRIAAGRFLGEGEKTR
jgi:transposase-like protein